MYTQKSNHLRSHLRAIMALDHSRFKAWKTKQALKLPFRFRHVYFTKSCQQIWGCVNQPVYTFYAPHLRWNSTIYYTDLGENAVFHNFSKQMHSVNIQDDQSWTFSENVQKMSKITYTASRFSHLKSAKLAVKINKSYSSTKIKNLLRLLFFFISWFITMCNLEKRLIRAAFSILLHAMSMNDWKQTAQWLKLQERLPTINKRNIIRWNIYRDNSFHSRRQVLKCF